MTALDPDDLATGLIRVASDGKVVWHNRSAAALLDRGAARLVRLPATVESALERARQTDAPVIAPEIPVAGDAEAVDVHVQATGDDFLVEVRPVAQRVRQRQLAERADRQQTLALLSRHLAHELRNPLAGVRGASQLIAAHGRDAAMVRHAQMIQREVDRIVRLIEHFAGGGELRMQPANLHRVIDEAAELISAETHERVRFARDFDASIPELYADASQLHQLFLNLLRNAAQAGAEQVLVTTRIEHHSPRIDDPTRHAIRIDIDDDGSGVPDGLAERLFLPMVSGRDDGTGFGLAIVQQIARGHGGLVEFHRLDRGSRFRIYLPLMQADEAGDD